MEKGVWLVRKDERAEVTDTSVWAFQDEGSARDAFNALCARVGEVYGSKEVCVSDEKHAFYDGAHYCVVERYFCKYGRSF